MGQFVCQACQSEHNLTISDLVVTAACELCGVLRGDWGWKRVALTLGHLLTHVQALRRAKLLQQIAECETAARTRVGSKARAQMAGR